jgi:hypothetical protein
MDEVCKSWYLGWNYQFGSAASSKEIHTLKSPYGMTQQQHLSTSDAYDVDSIMHYPTTVLTPLPDDSRDWVLSKWENGGPDFEPPEREPKYPNIQLIIKGYRDGVSRGDIQAVKMLILGRLELKTICTP